MDLIIVFGRVFFVNNKKMAPILNKSCARHGISAKKIMSKDQNAISTGRLDFGGGYYYIGEIENGEPNGEGAYYSPGDSLSREGTFKDGELNGYGTTYVKGEKSHEGYYVNGERSGKGVLYALGKKMYEGDFHHDTRNGKGTQWWLDGSKYVGDYVDDKRTGKGILYIDGFKRYEGDFVDGKFHGIGILYDEKGDILYSGRFENGSVPFAAAPMKGNKWVTITAEGSKTVANSYTLRFNLPPHSPNLKDTLELYMRCVENASEHLSALAIYAHFTSKGKNALILGGYPAELRDGAMTVNLKGNKSIKLDPSDISHEMSTVDTSMDEVVYYRLDKEVLKSICDEEIVNIELTGWESWGKKQLAGEEILFLIRAFWNGVFDDKEYVSYLQHSSAAPRMQKRGCYIATAVYGSYDCPEVWTLRRFRDYSLDKTFPGRVFIKFYYAISPKLVKWFGKSMIFKSMCRRPLDKLVSLLRVKGYKNTPYYDKY